MRFSLTAHAARLIPFLGERIILLFNGAHGFSAGGTEILCHKNDDQEMRIKSFFVYARVLLHTSNPSLLPPSFVLPSMVSK